MDIWQIDLADTACAGNLDSWMDVLDAQEKQRASRFRFERHAKRFVLAHAATRFILSSYCGMRPDELAFEYGAHGKPALANCTGLVFNLSHSEDMALCAVASEGQIGVDVEKCRDIDDVALVQRYFSKVECALFQGLTSTQKREGFFSCWTRKEAYIKARGLGLSLPLDAFSVDFRPGRPAALIASDYAPQDVGRFHLVDLPLAGGYKAALAYCRDDAAPLDPPRWRKADFHVS